MSKVSKSDKSGFEDDGFRLINPDFFSAGERDRRSQESGIDCSYEAQKKIYESQGLKVSDGFNVCRAQQSMGDDHNIVNLVDRLVRNGQGVEMPVPISDAFVQGIDYHTAMNQIRQADADFMQLPAEVRARFDNDAGTFLDFFNNPDNYEEARKLGFLAPTEAKAPLKVELSEEDRKSFFGFRKPKEEGVES